MKTKIPVTWIVLLGLMSSITLGILLEQPKTASHSTFVFGSAHEHASISVKIFDDPFDFSQERFQLQSSFIHLENNNGYVIHRHSVGVTIGYLFETLNLGLLKDCFVFQHGKEFCSNDDYTLKFYINEKRVDGVRDYIIFEGDLILISYGAETQDEIERQFAEQNKRGFPFQIRERNSNNLSNV